MCILLLADLFKNYLHIQDRLAIEHGADPEFREGRSNNCIPERGRVLKGRAPSRVSKRAWGSALSSHSGSCFFTFAFINKHSFDSDVNLTNGVTINIWIEEKTFHSNCLAIKLVMHDHMLV